MSDVERILAHYDGVLNGDAWHGDAVWRTLDSISVEQASARPIAGVHTIWELVMHMIFWEEVAAKRLAGQRAGLVEELNFPAMPPATEENWRETLDELRLSNGKFRDALAKLQPARLNEMTAAGKRTYYGEAHGVMEHHVYHLGQIAMLRKAQLG
jgi:uncharacterized damage-inducible protein DinB